MLGLNFKNPAAASNPKSGLMETAVKSLLQSLGVNPEQIIATAQGIFEELKTLNLRLEAIERHVARAADMELQLDQLETLARLHVPEINASLTERDAMVQHSMAGGEQAVQTGEAIGPHMVPGDPFDGDQARRV